jgi:hypothetical protein
VDTNTRWDVERVCRAELRKLEVRLMRECADAQLEVSRLRGELTKLQWDLSAAKFNAAMSAMFAAQIAIAVAVWYDVLLGWLRGK